MTLETATADHHGDLLLVSDSAFPPRPYKRWLRAAVFVSLAAAAHAVIFFALPKPEWRVHSEQNNRTIEVSILHGALNKHSDATNISFDAEPHDLPEIRPNTEQVNNNTSTGLSPLDAKAVESSKTEVEKARSAEEPKPDTKSNSSTPNEKEETSPTSPATSEVPADSVPPTVSEDSQPERQEQLEQQKLDAIIEPTKVTPLVTETDFATNNSESARSHTEGLIGETTPEQKSLSPISKKGTLLDIGDTREIEIETQTTNSQDEQHIFSPELVKAIRQAQQDQDEYIKGQVKPTDYVITEDGDGTQYVDIHGVCWKIPELGSDDEWVIVLDGCNKQTKTFHFELNITTDILAPESPLNNLLQSE